VAFVTRISVAFGETDPAGLVYYPNILHYCHVAMERFFAECCNVAYSSLIQDQRIGFPTVKVEAEFAVPIVYGDNIDVEMRILKLGRSSIRVSYSISRSTDQVVCARIEQVQVAMDLITRHSRPIPNGLRERFDELLHCL